MKYSSKKLTVYVRNATYTPSNYYRIIQYTKDFPFDVQVREALNSNEYLSYMECKKKVGVLKYVFFLYYYLLIVIRTILNLTKDFLSPPDTVIVSKSFCPKYTPFFILLAIRGIASKSQIIWDFDDDIFYSKEISKAQGLLLQKKSKKIVVTGEELKQKIDTKFREKVKKMPTTDKDNYIDNLPEVNLSRLSEFDEKIILVWVGTAGNLIHVEYIINELDIISEVLSVKYNKKCELRIICDKDLICNTETLTIKNIAWKREIVKNELSKAHIGIMPLIENEFTKGKGGFKIIQYLSAGLPVVGSGVGINKKIITNEIGVIADKSEDWILALELLADKKTWVEKSEKAQLHWQKNFSYRNNLENWIRIILDKEI